MRKRALFIAVCTFMLLTACGGKETPASSTPVASPSPQASEDTAAKEGALNNQSPAGEADDNAKLELSLEVSGGSVDVDPEDTDGFLNEVTFNEIEVVEDYLEAGVNVDALDDNGFGALHKAMQKNSTDMAKLLLDHGADINIVNAGSYTPLLTFTEYNSVDMVRFLLENGADPNIGGGDNDDYYPLIAATRFNYSDIVKLLLDHGAFPNLEYLDNGETVNAMQIAENYGFTEIVELIKKSLE
ncbi:hypothetical protein PAECIP111893_02358 [Paenibacillus plantiphilus]|uniref:Ankyrin repeat-containing protein n=1 Tax=Paenibacillus plantiphilus TaxID=2905650 RepID=A0ABM9C6P7_9BACL|nr:ankyrin repeat domain-containing protein [Paenibacillus plantiphilus]CAH1205489.1 hypothetical protein PAECIP111893_02358 [Paenibacillus plantiphilus]